MRKTKFKFYLIYFLIGLLVYPIFNYKIFFGDSSDSGTVTSLQTYTVEVGDITNSIETTGDASLVDEQSLQFNKEGTITAVNFSEGDEVKSGDVIAEIDNTDAYTSIEEAEISLENAKISLQQLYDGEDESKIASAKNTIINTQQELEVSEKELENLKISQANYLTKLQENLDIENKNLETLKSDLEISKSELETLKKEQDNSLDTTTNNKNATVTDIETDFKGYITNASTIINGVDTILGVTEENKDKNDSYDEYLGAKDSSVKSQAKNSLLSSISIYNSVKETLDNYSYSGNEDDVNNILNDLNELYSSLYETTDLAYSTADSSISSVGSLTESEIDSMKNSMNSDRNTVLSKISSIKKSLEELKNLTDTDLVSESNDNKIASKEKTIESQKISIQQQENSIANLEKSYNETVEDNEVKIQTKNNSIEKSQKSLETAKLSLEELLEGPTEENVTKAQNSIKSAELKLKSAEENLEDYELTAPFDGTIDKIDYMVGDNLTSDSNKYVYIQNPNLLEITVFLDQIDIVNVKKGDNAIVTFDAYSDTPVSAVINSINTNPSQSAGVVSYEVNLILTDNDFEKTILSGFTADVEIINEEKNNVLLLKTSAIQEDNDGNSYVNLIKNGQIVKTNIEIGIASNGMTEIISGLEEGDIIQIESFISTSEKDSSASLLFGSQSNLGGGGGGGGRIRP